MRGLPHVLALGPESADGSGGRSWLVEAELGHDIREDLARCAVSRDWGLVELRPVTLSLEDVFLKLTADEAAS
jgi:ABC-2 type transport system ATP-binding protein